MCNYLHNCVRCYTFVLSIKHKTFTTMATVIINTRTKATAKKVIDRIADAYGLNFTDWGYCATGNVLTATLQDDNTIELTGAYGADSLEFIAKKFTKATITF